MPAEDYFVAQDLDALRRENELLSLENAFLKGRITALEQGLREAKKREEAARSGEHPPKA